MRLIFFDPFSDDLHKVLHLRRLRVAQHCNDFGERFSVLLSSNDLLEHTNRRTALSFPVPVNA